MPHSQKNKKADRSGQAIRYSAMTLAAAAIVFCAVFSVRAWVEPSASPPGGNIAAPLHTGSTSQTKQGSLAVYGAGGYGMYAQGASYGVYGYETDTGAYGLLGYSGYGGYFNGPTYTNSYSYSAIMYDSNNGGYYIDPDGTSRLHYTVNNYVYAYGWMQAAIFYDANDNGYYVDPNNYSNLNRLNVTRTGAGECCSGGDYTLSLAESTSGTGRRAGIQFHNGGESEGQFKLNPGPHGRELLAYSYQTDMDLRATGVVRGDQGICIGGDCRSSWPNSADTLQTVTDRGWTTSQPLYTSNYMQAPILYDTDNAGYYMNPSGNSRLSQLYYVDSAYVVDLRPQYMYDWNDGNYYIDMNNGSRFNYLGRNYGWNWTEYDWNDTNYYMDLNNVSILNDLRVNILYDRENTGYYVDPNYYSNVYAMQPAYSFNGPVYDWNHGGYYIDPNSTSRLNYGVFDNVYSYSWMQAPIMYDSNDNGYYSDPNGTSRLNYAVINNVYNYGEVNSDVIKGRSQVCIGNDCRNSWPAEANQSGAWFGFCQDSPTQWGDRCAGCGNTRGPASCEGWCHGGQCHPDYACCTCPAGYSKFQFYEVSDGARLYTCLKN